MIKVNQVCIIYFNVSFIQFLTTAVGKLQTINSRKVYEYDI